MTKLLPVLVAATLFIACSQNPAPGGTPTDTPSVKSMNADSNSEMPVHIPKDSTARMPNALDSRTELKPS